LGQYIAKGLADTVRLTRFAHASQPLDFIGVRDLGKRLRLAGLMTNKQHLVPEANDVYLLSRSHGGTSKHLNNSAWQSKGLVWLRLSKHPRDHQE